jgi:branched-chain amino acid transport system substrate-binding protein
MSRRAFACWVVAVALAMMVTACRKQESESIAIGAVLPISGANAPQGEYARNGINMAVSEINAAGGVGGKVLRIVYGDSQSTVDAGVPAYQTIITGSRVPATLAILNPVVVKVALIADREKGVLLNCGAQDSDLRKGGPFVFNLVPDAIEEARAMAEFAITRLRLTEAATFAVDRDSGMAAAAEFAQTFTRLGGRIVREEMVEKEGEFVVPAIVRLESEGPPATFVAAPPATTAKLLRAAKELGFSTQWLANSSFEIDGARAAAGPAAEGVTYTALRTFSIASPRARQFATDYKGRFGFAPEMYAVSCYDAVHALAAAIKAGGGASSVKIASGMRMRVLDGVAGRLDFTKANWVERPFEIRTVKDGRTQIVPDK